MLQRTKRFYVMPVVLLSFLFSEVSFAVATSNSLTYQGRIVRSDGTPLEHPGVSFIFQITDPRGSCVIYQEQIQGYNMSNSRGIFDVPIGSGTISWPLSGAFGVIETFNNSSTFTCGDCAGTSCSAGSASYSPLVADGRLLRVQFFDGAGWKLVSPDTEIRSVPFAGYSQAALKLGSNIASDFLIKKDINNPGSGSMSCDSGSFLTWNASTLKMGCAAAPTAGAISLSGDVSGTAASVSVNKIKGTGIDFSVAPISGQFLKYNGSHWTPANVPTATPSQWTDAGANIYFTTGMVGIGTPSPQRRLHVRADGAYQMRLENGNNGGGYWNVGQTDTSFGTGGGKLLFIPDSDVSTDAKVVFTNSGRVGIGTTSPSVSLQVADLTNATSTTTGAMVIGGGLGVGKDIYTSGSLSTTGMISSGTSNIRGNRLLAGYGSAVADFGSDSNKAITFTPDGSERMRIDVGGKVGIGTTNTPQAGIHLYGISSEASGVSDSGSKASTLRLDAADWTAGAGGSLEFAASRKYFGAIRGNATDTSNNGVGYLTFLTRNLTTDTSLTERMRILSDGRVGIGTTSPASILQISKDSESAVTKPFGDWQGNGQFFISGKTAPLQRLAMGVDTVASPMVSVIQSVEAGVSARSLALNPAGGNVGVGTNNPTASLHVSTTAVTGNIATFVSTGAGGAGCSIAWNGTACSSDLRLKENIISVKRAEALNNLLQVRPVHFTWIRDQNHEKQTGFIAQEFEKLFPEFVKTDDNGFKQVNYAHFVSVITGALQGLYLQWKSDSRKIHHDIVSLQAENQALKKENAEIKERLEKIEKALSKK